MSKSRTSVLRRTPLLITFGPYLADKFVPETDSAGFPRVLRAALNPNGAFRVQQAPIPDFIHWTTDDIGVVS